MTLQLDEWQKEVLNYKGNIVLCSGRQTGKSTIISIKAAETAINNPNQQILIVSLTLEQAELMMMKILDYVEKKYPKHMAAGKNKPTKHKLSFKNGSWIRCRPVGNTGDAVRGFTGTLLIADEAAFMPEPLWLAAKPTLLTTGGDIILISTPHGKQGYFYECFQNKNENFKVFHINTEEVIEKREVCDSWTITQREKAISFLEMEKKEMSAMQYAQEYLGQFVDEFKQFFPDELVLKAMTAKRPNQIVKSQNYYLGVDIARMGKDESTFEIVQKRGERLVQVENQITTKTKLNETTRHILELNKIYDFEKIFVDDEGIGVGVFDYLIENEETRRKTEAINNSKRVKSYREEKHVKILKEDLYNHMLKLLEWGHIQLLDDEKIFQSFKSVQYEYTQDNFGKFYLKIFGNYTHIVEGLIRAAWALKYKDLNIWIKSI